MLSKMQEELEQTRKQLAEAPKEKTRTVKPRREDFTQCIDGVQQLNDDAYKQAVSQWAKLEREYIDDPQYIELMTSTLKGTKEIFHEYRTLYLSETKTESGKQAKFVPALTTAEIIYKLLPVIKLDNEEGLIAVYNSEKGIYETSENYFHKLIHCIEPTYSIAKSKEVLFKLGILSEIKGQTVNRYLIPVANGIFNKKTQELEPFNSNHIFTSTIATKYKADAQAPNIEGWNVDDWFSELLDNDDELVKVLWQVVSASTNGNYSYRKSAWLVGEGNSGKGTVQSLIMNLIGRNNVASVKVEQFQDRFGLSQVVGKTVIIGDDSQVKYLDNAGNFFSVVTGDPVPVEAKGKTPTLAVFNKLVIQSANFLPKFHNKSNGTYRRLLIIPFNQAYTPETDNWSIKNDYITRPEVLEYVLKKALSLNFDRFIEPKATKKLLDEFKMSNDTILSFITGDFEDLVSDFLPTTFITTFYQSWCELNGVKAFSKREFEMQLPKYLAGKWEKSKQKPSTAGFNQAVDIRKAKDFPKFGITFIWDEDKQKQQTRGYRRIK